MDFIHSSHNLLISNLTGAYKYPNSTSTPSNHSNYSKISEHISFYCALAMIICCIYGTLCNLVSFLIYTRPKMLSPINVLLAGLSMVDLIGCALTIPSFALQGINVRIKNRMINQFCIYAIVSIYPCAMISQSASVWLVVVITIERYIAVCKPLTARRYSKKRALVSLGSVILASCVYNMPRFFEFRLSKDLHSNFTTVEERLRSVPLYYNLYYTSIFVCTHLFVPFSILLIMNIFIVSAVRSASRFRQNCSVRGKQDIRRSAEGGIAGGFGGKHHTNRREHSTARMMVIVTTAFALCNCIPFVLNIVEGIKRDLFVDENTKRVAYAFLDIGNTLVVFNSASTFFIYYRFSQKYRMTFMRYFCRCFYKSHNDIFSKIGSNGITMNSFTYDVIPNASGSSGIYQSVATNPGAFRSQEFLKVQNSVSPRRISSSNSQEFEITGLMMKKQNIFYPKSMKPHLSACLNNHR